MAKQVTLKDVARASGVHASTVSRALDPAAKASLSADVVKRVREAARQLGYRRNNLARSLRTKRTMTVGMMLPDITNTLFAPIVRGAESILEPHGYASLIVNTDDDREREDILINVLLERGVDGILNAAARLDSERMTEIARSGIPVVTANREIDNSSIPSILSDDANGIRLLLACLTDHGHRHIAHIAGPTSLSTGRLRLQVFEQAAREAQCNTQIIVENAARFDEAEGRRCALSLLDRRARFTALVCANDLLALGALDALKDRGLTCPDDISITGYNNLPFLDLVTPGLTTIHVRHADLGRLSGELLLKMMSDKEAVIPRRTILPVHLVERASVAPVR